MAFGKDLDLVDTFALDLFRCDRRSCMLAQMNLKHQRSLDILRGALFDHLIGAEPNRRRYHKTKRLGGLEVYQHLELSRQLNR